MGPIVQGFGAGGFSIDGQSYRAALLTPERAELWSPPPLAELRIEHLETLLGGERTRRLSSVFRKMYEIAQGNLRSRVG